MSGLPIQECAGCGARHFPPHLACGECGGLEFRSLAAKGGEVLAATLLRRRPGATSTQPVSIALVKTDLGPVIVARGHAELSAGERVGLDADGLVPMTKAVER
jgi:uncharacterized OB-fold protein